MARSVLVDGILAALRVAIHGLPVLGGLSGVAVLIVWGAIGLGLWAGSVCRVMAARFGWAMFGGASIALVAVGAVRAPHAGAVVVAAAAWWMVLSIVAYHQVPLADLRLDLARLLRLPAPARHTVPAGGDADDDDVSSAVVQYGRLVRRAAVRGGLLPADGRVWTVSATSSSGFSAHDQNGRHVTGWARSAEDFADTLCGLTHPSAAVPIVHWSGPLLTVRDPHQPDEHIHGALGRIDEFMHSRPDQLRQIIEAVHHQRAEWDLGSLDEQITIRAHQLNSSHPLIGDEDCRTTPGSDEPPRFGVFFDWINPDTIISGPARSWNDFASHQPDIVATIIRSLLTTTDPAAMLHRVMGQPGHVHVHRLLGPAGPVHRISINGTHRSHAFRILGLPLIAGEVTLHALPVTVTELDMWGPQFDGAVEPLWRGMIHRGLLYGRIVVQEWGSILEPHHTDAPWILLPPEQAVVIAAAYDRVYPGALAEWGIPAHAWSDQLAWRRWLTDDSPASPRS